VEILTIIIGLLLTVGVGWYIAQPLTQSKHAMLSKDAGVTPPEVQRDLLYAQIRELDLDHATGKTNDEDHNQIRAELVAQAADTLRRIDGLAALPEPPLPGAQPIAVTIDDDLEAAIAARRKKGQRVAAAPDREAELEAAIAARRKTSPQAPANIDQQIELAIAARRSSAPPLKCPNCDRPVTSEDVFCSKCGASLQTQTAR
jgi:zinc-ribbon domain